jgi:hypothetical protein
MFNKLIPLYWSRMMHGSLTFKAPKYFQPIPYFINRSSLEYKSHKQTFTKENNNSHMFEMSKIPTPSEIHAFLIVDNCHCP